MVLLPAGEDSAEAATRAVDVAETTLAEVALEGQGVTAVEVEVEGGTNRIHLEAVALETVGTVAVDREAVEAVAVVVTTTDIIQFRLLKLIR